jgi:hypothetical protein
MHDRRKRLPSLPVVLFVIVASALAACAAAAGSPGPTEEPTVRPTPTPIAAPVSQPADAASIVIASDPRFAGAIQLTPDIIGASRYWTAEALPSGGYRVVMTVGWGDCPAGCINKHVWTFDVDPAGKLALVSESGDEIPSDFPA